jgi:hypothetical protein
MTVRLLAQISVILAIAACGCEDSGTGVVLTITGPPGLSRVDVVANYDQEQIQRTLPAPDSTASLETTILAKLPDRDTGVTFIVTGTFLSGSEVQAGTMQIAVKAHEISSAQVDLYGAPTLDAGVP